MQHIYFESFLEILENVFLNYPKLFWFTYGPAAVRSFGDKVVCSKNWFYCRVLFNAISQICDTKVLMFHFGEQAKDLVNQLNRYVKQSRGRGPFPDFD